MTATICATSETARTAVLPRAAASVLVWRGRDVLLIERGRGALAGSWSFPGGHVEAGETAAQAACREVAEEAGVAVALEGLLDVHDVIVRDGGGLVTAQYMIAVFMARWTDGEPRAGGDVRDVRFVPLDRVRDYRLTEGLWDLISRARPR